MPNVRATADHANPTATADVAGVTLDQFTSINLDTTDAEVKEAVKAGLITVLDSEPYDKAESAAQIKALEEQRAAAAAAAAPAEEAEDEAADTTAHAATQRHRSSRST